MPIHFVEDEKSRVKFFPLTYTRPIADLRVGILKLSEKWGIHLNFNEFSFHTQPYLSGKFRAIEPTIGDVWIFNGVLPSVRLVEMVRNLNEGEGLFEADNPIAIKSRTGLTDQIKRIQIEGIDIIEYPWDIFRMIAQEIQYDFDRITMGKRSESIEDPHTVTYGEQIFVEKGVTIKSAILNSEKGPIYLGEGSVVSEGAIIQGPFSLGEQSTVSIGAKIRGGTSVGPYCKIGGEVSNSSLQGFSNKGHDGFLGNSVLGEWCNLGADTNNSNLKNNYENVKMWDFESGGFRDTGMQFCGLIMGDHSKCGINTMFNTGTTVGVSANIFGEGFPRNIIPSFAWGGSKGFSTYKIEKALKTAEIVMGRRRKKIDQAECEILEHVYHLTSVNRIWEKK